MESLQLQESNKTKRIEYIDALRGLTIILVIYSHINTTLIDLDSDVFSFNNIFISFRMPLFFFISGFVLYKDNLFVTWNQVRVFLIKKAKVQIIPTLFFLAVFIIIFRLDIKAVLESSVKGGYWFTLILFVYFCSYSMFSLILRSLCVSKTYNFHIFIFLSGVIIYFLANPIITGGHIAHILSLPQYKYFVFFILGTIVKSRYEDVKSLVQRNSFSTSIILIFIGVTILLEIIEFSNFFVELLFQIIQSFSGVLFIFMFFEKNQEWCSHETKVGRALQYVGKRTLDIYLIHYFFLPHHMLWLGNFFVNYPNPTIELFVSLFLALLVLSLCLVTSNLLRCSDFLTEWLFFYFICLCFFYCLGISFR